MAQSLDTSKQEMLTLIRRFQKEKVQPPMMPKGVNPSEASVIMAVFMAREHEVSLIQPSQVAEWLRLTPSALSQTLKALEEKDFIERHRNSEDSRVISLELTQQGVELAEEMARMHDSFLDDLVAYVGQEDLDHLLKSLNKVLDFLSEQAEARGIQEEIYSCHGHGYLRGAIKAPLSTKEPLNEKDVPEE